mmetsp:Transcript_53258/g.116272  ORF Transcript_53258/g.116272 Transcript_53258/m.116272 type:complete len:234 (+) Transcript_53258:1347-2048(+)
MLVICGAWGCQVYTVDDYEVAGTGGAREAALQGDRQSNGHISWWHFGGRFQDSQLLVVDLFAGPLVDLQLAFVSIGDTHVGVAHCFRHELARVDYLLHFISAFVTRVRHNLDLRFELPHAAHNAPDGDLAADDVRLQTAHFKYVLGLHLEAGCDDHLVGPQQLGWQTDLGVFRLVVFEHGHAVLILVVFGRRLRDLLYQDFDVQVGLEFLHQVVQNLRNHLLLPFAIPEDQCD